MFTLLQDRFNKGQNVEVWLDSHEVAVQATIVAFRETFQQQVGMVMRVESPQSALVVSLASGMLCAIQYYEDEVLLKMSPQAIPVTIGVVPASVLEKEGFVQREEYVGLDRGTVAPIELAQHLGITNKS